MGKRRQWNSRYLLGFKRKLLLISAEISTGFFVNKRRMFTYTEILYLISACDTVYRSMGDCDEREESRF